MNINHNPQLTLGKRSRNPRVRAKRTEISISLAAAILFLAGVITLWKEVTVFSAGLFFFSLLLCSVKIYLLNKHRQSSFTWLFNFVIIFFFLIITFIDLSLA